MTQFHHLHCSCSQRRMWQYRRRSRCSQRLTLRDNLLPPFKPLAQLRDELKKEFNLSDEELDQHTMYLL